MQKPLQVVTEPHGASDGRDQSLVRSLADAEHARVTQQLRDDVALHVPTAAEQLHGEVGRQVAGVGGSNLDGHGDRGDDRISRVEASRGVA